MNTQVLIAGAGPTGLVLACDLLRRGVTVRIVDAAPEFHTGSRGKGLQPRSLEVFDDLGLIEPVLAEAEEYPVLRRYADGAVVWEGRTHEPAAPSPARPYPNLLMLPQARTEQLLRARLAELGGRVELGVRLTGCTQDDQGVTATLETAGRTERVRAGYLVGADGGRSTVRKELGIGFAGDTYETERMVVGDVRVDGLDREHWHAWGRPGDEGRWLALCPLPGTGSFQFMATVAPDEAPEPTAATVRRLIEEATGDPDIRPHEPTWLSLYRPNIRMADRFRAGRVFLAGDAAHVHSPAGGQGLNTGIQDAYNLGWKLAAGSEALLDSYEEERLPMAADVLGLSTRLHHARSVRRDPETNQLGIGYRGGSLSDPEWTGELRPGDRAPDGRCRDAGGQPVRLFDLFRGPHWTLLAVGAEPPGSRAGVRAHAVDTAYDLPAGTFALVRPDGYVGLITAEPGRVDRYLDLVGSVSGSL
ncbi:FAD-dependent oxidoreductase [Actinophytocola sp.]|uniref:FAD-dependent oxidoreductase n=1 Tax=Actinophytocola sp. TaxID=1872138 RepID=UPI002D7E2632|nr:FAD-dependent oxidoreductase [Actinophytocola sp.]HET9140486.1 FAD-dependent oxidoreductase [Actinophytocola sp.]